MRREKLRTGCGRTVGNRRHLTSVLRRASKGVGAPLALESLEGRRLLAVNPVGPEVVVAPHEMLRPQRPVAGMDADGDFVLLTKSGSYEDTSLSARLYTPAGVAKGEAVPVAGGHVLAYDVAMDADGDWVAVWRYNDDYSYANQVRFRRFNAAGVPQGPVRRVEAAEASGDVAVAMEPDGDFVIAWSGYGSAGEAVIAFERFTAAAVPAGDAVVVVSDPAAVLDSPDVAVNASGAVALAWVQGGGQVVWRGYSPANVPGTIVVAEAANGWGPSVGVDGAGRTVLAFQTAVDTGVPTPKGSTFVYGVTVKGYNQAGVETASAILTTGVDAETRPDAAIGATGAALVAWVDQIAPDAWGVRETRFDAAAGAVGTPATVASLPPGAEYDGASPTVAADADGDGLVAWDANSGEYAPLLILAQRYSSAGNPVGAAIDLSPLGGFDQERPSVASDAAGNYVVLFEDDGTTHLGLQARLYSADGSPRGPLFRVAQGETSYHDVAMDADGDFVVTWVDYATYQTFARAFDENGVPAGPAFPVSSAGGQEVFASNAQVAMTPGGQFAVAWASYPENAVYLRRFAANGQPLGNDVRVNADGEGSVDWLDLSVDASFGIAVAWQWTFYTGIIGAFYYGRELRCFDAGGTPLSGPVTLATTSSSVGAVAAVGGGQVVVAYDVYDSVQEVSVFRLARYTTAGTPVGAEINAATSEDGFIRAAVAAEPDGDYVVAWQEGYNDQTVSFRRSLPGGAGLAAAVPVPATAGTDQRLGGVAIDADGDVLVATSQQYGDYSGGEVVYVQRFAAGAAAGGTPVLVATPTLFRADLGGVAMNAAGQWVALVAGNRNSYDDGSGGLFVRRYDAAGNAVGRDVLVTMADVDGADVAIDADGDVVVVWYDYGYDGTTAFARRFTAGGAPAGPAQALFEDSIDMLAVAMDADGDFVVVWTQGYSYGGHGAAVAARRYPADGTPAVGAELGGVGTLVSDVGQDARSVDVAMAPDGSFIVTWTTYDEGEGETNLFAKRYDAAGEPVGPRLDLAADASTSDGDLSVAVNAAGDFVVAWQESYDASGWLYARRYGGGTLGATVLVAEDDAADDPVVVLDADGDFVVAWSSGDTYDYDGHEIRARRFSADGSKWESVPLSSPDERDDVAIGIDGAGNLLLAWDQDDFVVAQRFAVTDTWDLAYVSTATGRLVLNGTGAADALVVASDGNGAVTVTGGGGRTASFDGLEAPDVEFLGAGGADHLTFEGEVFGLALAPGAVPSVTVESLAGVALLGSGTVRLGHLTLHAGAFFAPVQSGVILEVSSLTMEPFALLHIGDGALVVKYGGGASPAASLAALIADAYTAGAWTSNGINSYLAQGDETRSIGIGFDDDGQRVRIRATYYGDANLDGRVSADDVATMLLAQSQGKKGWSAGNFNYDARISADDWAAFGQGAAYARGNPLPDLFAGAASPAAPGITEDLLTGAAEA